MIELIVAHPHAFWLSLGWLTAGRRDAWWQRLSALERCGRGDYRAAGLAAPPDWAWQGALFAVLTLVAAWLWWRWLNRQVNEQEPLDTHLNQRGQQIVGQRFTLETALVNGRGHMRVGDSSGRWWPTMTSAPGRGLRSSRWKGLRFG